MAWFEAVASVDRITTVKPVGDLADFVGGFVAGEGSFIVSGRRFAFSVGLGAADRAMCDLLLAVFEVGGVYVSPRREQHYDDEVCFKVNRLGDLIEVVVPFMDQHLPPSYKRQQYETWRAALLEYWDTKARRRRRCKNRFVRPAATSRGSLPPPLLPAIRRLRLSLASRPCRTQGSS